MDEKKNEKMIDVRNKTGEEILNIYNFISEETNLQNKIYDMVGNSEIASKIYKIYKYEEENKK